MKTRTAVAAAILIGSSIIVVGYVESPHAVRSGQLVFLPVKNLAVPGVSGLPPVRIGRCWSENVGAKVVGDATATPGGVTIVLSTGPDDRAPGLRIGAGEAWAAGWVQNANIGDFLVTLPWASTMSAFAQAKPGDPTLPNGPASFCP